MIPTIDLEQRLLIEQKRLKVSESRKDRYLKGVPDFEAYRNILEEDATNLLLLVRRLNVDEFPGNMDLLESIQLTINSSKQIIKEIDGIAPQIQPLLEAIKSILTDLDSKFNTEMERQAKARELEKETLENINAYLEKMS